MKMPEINQRILKLVDTYTNRNVKKFAESINIPQQTVNRLFNIDRRTQKYPIVTTETLQAITKMYVEVNAAWLLSGKGEMLNSDHAHDEKIMEYLKEKDQKIEMLLFENAQLKLKLEQIERSSTSPSRNAG